MKTPTSPNPDPRAGRRHPLWLALGMAALVGACGGGDPALLGTSPVDKPAPLASATTTLSLDTVTLVDAGGQAVQPSFHLAPVLLDPPDDTDAQQADASAQREPRRQALPPEAQVLSSRRLTVETLQAARDKRLADPAAFSTEGAAQGDEAFVAKAGSAVTTYTPAQIRAAYGLPALPAAGTTLSAAQAALLGAGQTIYIIDAMHNPNVAAELAAFNTKFGLPACTSKPIAPTATLPLATASSSGCELSVVYSTMAGGMTATAPAYDAGWATEIALDVQWAHATAPLARIVLIETGPATLDNLLGGLKLANAMGPGVVSLSLGANEGNWTASVDSVFSGSGMTYLAAAGDSGAGVSWPAVSPKVVAVGGTSLTYTGSGARSEVVWTKSGGGVSAYTPTPAYQTSAVPGMGTPVRRNVSDVAFNADPATGQYVAVMTPGSTAVNWVSAGGTSLSTPQWAGLIAVANAQRTAAAKARLGAPHSVLYSQIASVPGTYASVFADITKGANGSCTACIAKTGYDTPSGLGTPNGSSLLSALSGASTAASAPVVTPAAISGTAGQALSFTVSVNAPNTVTYSLTGAPSGMSIASTGVVSWPSPVAGSYAVTVTAKDTKTGLSGQGVYNLTVAAAQAPTVASATITGRPGVALSYALTVKSTNTVTYSLSGAPAGMSVSSAGVLSWASPVLGSYSVTVSAKDSKNGLSGQGVISVKIDNTTTSTGLTITAPAMNGVVGKPLTGTIGISAPGASSLSVSISGAPLGMQFSVSGTTFTATWPSPVLGSYSLTIGVQDSLGRTAKATVPITVNAK